MGHAEKTIQIMSAVVRLVLWARTAMWRSTNAYRCLVTTTQLAFESQLLSIKCHCAEGYTGIQCQFLQTVNFDRASFIALPSAASRKNYSMVFSFRTTVKDGVILYQGKVSLLVTSMFCRCMIRGHRECLPAIFYISY